MNKDAANDIKEQLQQYIELGLSPIPLQGKVAKYPWKEFELTEDLMERGIKAGVNWGLRAGFVSPGLFLYFVDLDTKDMIGDFLETNAVPPGTPIVSTGRGFHFYLSWRGPVRTRHFAGMDIIGNGYVVCPPSIHPGGKPYRFIVPLKPSLPSLDPESFFSFNRPVSRAGYAREGRQDVSQNYLFDWNHIYQGVNKGSRHNTLIRYLGILHAQWHTQKEALAKALEWNSRNNPPLSENEVEGAVRSAWTEWNKRREDYYDHVYPTR